MSARGEAVSGVQEEDGGIEVVKSPVEEETGGEEETTDTSSETARETVARELKKLQEETSGDAGAETEEQPAPEAPLPVKKSAKVKASKVAKEPEVEIAPPNRLTAEQKEHFNKLPAPLKKATHAMFQNVEAQFTRAMQDARSAQKEAAHIVEAVRPYLLAHPELAEQGFTESKIVSGLLAAHQRLTNPKTALSTYADLGAQIGLNKEKIAAILEIAKGNGFSGEDIKQHPEFVSLQERFNALESKITGAEQKTLDAQVNSIVSEMEAVRDERNSAGQYLYPKLHDGEYLEQVKPLVSALVRAIPGLSYGEALKRAYHTIEGQNGNSIQTPQPRLSAAQLGRTERSAAAVASVRGRSAPITSAAAVNEPPEEALKDARSTVMWALQQHRQG